MLVFQGRLFSGLTFQLSLEVPSGQFVHGKMILFEICALKTAMLLLAGAVTAQPSVESLTDCRRLGSSLFNQLITGMWF